MQVCTLQNQKQFRQMSKQQYEGTQNDIDVLLFSESVKYFQESLPNYSSPLQAEVNWQRKYSNEEYGIPEFRRNESSQKENNFRVCDESHKRGNSSQIQFFSLQMSQNEVIPKLLNQNQSTDRELDNKSGNLKYAKIFDLRRTIQKSARYDTINRFSQAFMKEHALSDNKIVEWKDQKYQRTLQYYFSVLGIVHEAGLGAQYIQHIREQLEKLLPNKGEEYIELLKKQINFLSGVAEIFFNGQIQKAIYTGIKKKFYANRCHANILTKFPQFQ